jgi:AcrR family transcriptional regulator
VKLFGERGYEGTSMEEVARLGKTAVGTIYQHFRSKRQLLLVLMDELLGKIAEVPMKTEGAPDLRTVIRETLVAGFRVDIAYAGALRAWREAILKDSSLLEGQRQIEEWTSGRLAEAFTRIRALPGARKDVDPGALARVLDRFFWDLLVRPIEPMESTIDLVADLLFHGLMKDPVPRKGWRGR